MDLINKETVTIETDYVLQDKISSCFLKDEKTVAQLHHSFKPQYQGTNSPYWSSHISYGSSSKSTFTHQVNYFYLRKIPFFCHNQYIASFNDRTRSK